MTVMVLGPCLPSCLAVVPEHVVVLGVSPVPKKTHPGQVNKTSVVAMNDGIDPNCDAIFAGVREASALSA